MSDNQTQAANDRNPLDDLKKKTQVTIYDTNLLDGLTINDTLDDLTDINTLKKQTEHAIRNCENHCTKLKTHLSTLKEYCPKADDHKHKWLFSHVWHGSSSKCTLCNESGAYYRKGGSKRVRKLSNKTRKRNTKNGRYNAVHKRKTRRKR